MSERGGGRGGAVRVWEERGSEQGRLRGQLGKAEKCTINGWTGEER